MRNSIIVIIFALFLIQCENGITPTDHKDTAVDKEINLIDNPSFEEYDAFLKRCDHWDFDAGNDSSFIKRDTDAVYDSNASLHFKSVSLGAQWITQQLDVKKIDFSKSYTLSFWVKIDSIDENHTFGAMVIDKEVYGGADTQYFGSFELQGPYGSRDWKKVEIDIGFLAKNEPDQLYLIIRSLCQGSYLDSLYLNVWIDNVKLTEKK